MSRPPQSGQGTASSSSASVADTSLTTHDCTLVPSPDRRARLRPALGFAGLESCAQELRILHAWLDTWRGIGDVAVGMHRQGYDLQLTEYDERGWRATFYSSGMEHSATSATGSAFELAPWTAVQRAAWEVLTTHGDIHTPTTHDMRLDISQASEPTGPIRRI